MLSELRKWIITIILIVITIVIVWKIRSCGIQDILDSNEQLKKEKEVLLKEIEELKNLPPVTKTETIVKEKKIKVCIDRKTKKEISCSDNTLDNSLELEITKDICCRLGLGTKFSNKFIICEDKNICKENDETITWTDEGIKKFGKIEGLTQDIDKRSIWNFSLIAGSEFIQPGFMIGFNLINWNNIVFGTDMNIDLERIKDSDLGAYIGYRPKFRNWQGNFAFIGGIGTGMSNIGKKWSAQLGIIFYLIEKKNK